jgi:hypothetical protein
MKHFDTRVYSIADFLEWRNNDLLELSPDFQRRAVWSQNAKSYLVDTILRGKPMPKMIISQELRGSRTVRIVVDGQQRLRSILEFIDGNFKISRAHNRELSGYSFDLLPMEIQRDFLQYELGVDLLFDMSYEDVLDIFARINTYTVTLNTQELRNAKYVGYFKQYVYEYGYKYVRYFLEGGILTKGKVARMAEAELAAELLVALVGGVQTNKNTEQYYGKYEEEIGDLEAKAEQFDVIMSYIGAIYAPQDLSRTNWSRVQLFYTLFTAIGHCLYGLVGLDPNLRVSINEKSTGKLRMVLDEITLRYDEFTARVDRELIPKDYALFIDFSRRRTTDTSVRIGRASFVCEKFRSALI